MKKLASLAFSAALLLQAGCARTEWVERHVPTDDAQRAAIATHVEKILGATPQSLAGHDQDWDDAIAEAHRRATDLYCPSTYWEWDRTSATWTGRWRYADNKETPR